MKINEGIINEPTVSTLEVDNFEDELKKLKGNSNSDNNQP